MHRLQADSCVPAAPFESKITGINPKSQIYLCICLNSLIQSLKNRNLTQIPRINTIVGSKASNKNGGCLRLQSNVMGHYFSRGMGTGILETSHLNLRKIVNMSL